MSKKSTQKTLAKVRPPRVQVSYDVEVGGESVKKELPFVVGVVADLSAGASRTETRLRDRSFVEVNVDTFSKVMQGFSPTLRVKVPDMVRGEGDVLVELKFSDLESFSPEAIAHSVPQLARMLEARARLNDLLAKLDGNERLNDLLAEVVANSELTSAAKSELSKLSGSVGKAPANPDMPPSE